MACKLSNSTHLFRMPELTCYFFPFYFFFSITNSNLVQADLLLIRYVWDYILGKELTNAELAFCYCNKLLETTNFKEDRFILGNGGSLWQRDLVDFMIVMKSQGYIEGTRVPISLLRTIHSEQTCSNLVSYIPIVL